MKKLYCAVCGKYREFWNPRTSYIFEKKIVLSIIWRKSFNEDEKTFKEEESIEILKIIGLIKDI